MIASLRDCALFRGISEDDIRSCLKIVSPARVTFQKGDLIYSPCNFEKRFGIILRGECDVVREKGSGEKLHINSLHRNDSFGILAAFSVRDVFPTAIYAKTATDILFFEKIELVQIMEKCPQVSVNLIEFLADRINFLHDKISSFSSDNVEQRLSLYLLQLHKESQSTTLLFNKKAAAASLNTGRTSLYRALDSLANKGIIKIADKAIIIIDIIGLERISK